jgi:hypothetical protein
MKTIILDVPVTQTVQELIQREITEFEIIKYEDTGTTIQVLTNLGYVVTHDEDDYPEGGIFSLSVEDIDDIVISEIEKIR